MTLFYPHYLNTNFPGCPYLPMPKRCSNPEMPGMSMLVFFCWYAADHRATLLLGGIELRWVNWRRPFWPAGEWEPFRTKRDADITDKQLEEVKNDKIGRNHAKYIEISLSRHLQTKIKHRFSQGLIKSVAARSRWTNSNYLSCTVKYNGA